MILTDENYKDAIEQNNYILIEICSTWSEVCKDFEPKYIKAAQELLFDYYNIILAKADVTLQ